MSESNLKQLNFKRCRKEYNISKNKNDSPVPSNPPWKILRNPKSKTLKDSSIIPPQEFSLYCKGVVSIDNK